MRARWLLVCMTALACGETDEEASRPTSSEDAALQCETECPPCPNGTQCVKAGSFNKPIIPACLKLCIATRECEPGEKCLLRDGNTKGIAVCVSATLPAQCGEYETGHCDFFGYAECHDHNTLRTGVAKLGVFCGLELTHCEDGCGGADGGIYPGTCL
jgi:hypothetical protein